MTEARSACRDRTFAIGALADGELDALATLTIEEHLRACAGCRAELERIEQLRTRLAEPGLRVRATEGLRRRIAGAAKVQARAPRPSARRPQLAPLAGGAMVGALAASLTLCFVLPNLAERGLADALVDGQIRSLQNGHLVDVMTSDRHTVKPWFNGRITYSPPVVDLEHQGFPLVGGRLDVIERENVAVLVYKRRLHTINLFVRPLPAMASRFSGNNHAGGYNVVRWTMSGLEYWAVSDVDQRELEAFRVAFTGEVTR